jgi:hypothetical protein
MIATLLLSSFLASQSAPVRVPVFVPRLNVKILPAAPARLPKPPEIVCAMPMIQQTPAADPKILMPPRDTGAVIRRIEPRACQSRIR